MKKIFLILLLSAFLIQCTSPVFAEVSVNLSEKTTVNVENTDTCFAKPTLEEKYSGEYSLHFKASGADWLEVSQNLTKNVTAGGQYVITVVAKPVSGTVWFRVGWDDSGWLSSGQRDHATALGDGWYKYVKTVTLAANQTKFLFHNDGATEFYIDDISLVKVGDSENLMPDGGFEDVIVSGGVLPPEDIPDEDLILSDTTRVNTDADNCYARVTDDEKYEGNYSLHLYTAGDWLEIAQNYTKALTPGRYTLTWYAKGSGRIWFYSNWGTEWAASHAVDSVVEMADGWKKYTRGLNIDGNGDTSFLFHSDGAVDQYIDGISLVDENGINYIIDGGFEEVTISGDDDNTGGDNGDDDEGGDDIGGDDNGDDTQEENDRYKNELILSETTVINNVSDENCYAEASEKYFRGDAGYSLHFVSSGNPDFTVSQATTELCEAGGEYVLTVYAKRVSGRVWFRAGWGDNAWMVAAEEGEPAEDGWLKYEKTIIIDADGATSLFFYSDQESEFYIDDITLVKVGETENLMPDGSFEEVTVIPPVIPDFEVLAPVLEKGTEEVSRIQGAGEYTVSVKAKNNALESGLSVEVLVAVFNSAGEMVNLCHDKADVEVTEPNAPDTKLSVPFTAEAGYTAEVYVINNRQDIDVYYNPISY